MHSSFTVHHPPVAAATHPSTLTTPTSASTASTSTVIIRPTAPPPRLSSTTRPHAVAAFSSSLSRASGLDQALFYAGVLSAASAAAYAAYTYWQRSSHTAATAPKAAVTRRPAAAASVAASNIKLLPASASASSASATEFAAATAVEQLTKPVDSQQQADTTPAATVSALPAPLRSRLSAARGILFDLDGTLVESAEIWYRLISGASKHFGYAEVSREEWQATFGQSMEKNVEMWMQGLDQAQFNRYCDEHYADHLQHLHILDGSIDLLQLVNRKYGVERVAIVTNCPRAITEIILQHLRLGQHFSHVVCAGDSIDSSATSPALLGSSASPTYALQPKPATDILVQGAHQLGVPVRECVFVGDSRYDMLSGRAAGCATVGIGIRTGDVYATNTREAVTLFERL